MKNSDSFNLLYNDYYLSALTQSQKDTLFMIHEIVQNTRNVNDIIESIDSIKAIRATLFSMMRINEADLRIIEEFDAYFEKRIFHKYTNIQKNAMEQLILTNKGIVNERDTFTHIFESFVYPVIYLDNVYNIKFANIAGVNLLEMISQIYFKEMKYDFNFSKIYQNELSDFLNDPFSESVKFYDANLDVLYYFMRTEKLVNNGKGYLIYAINQLNDFSKYLRVTSSSI